MGWLADVDDADADQLAELGRRDSDAVAEGLHRLDEVGSDPLDVGALGRRADLLSLSEGLRRRRTILPAGALRVFLEKRLLPSAGALSVIVLADA